MGWLLHLGWGSPRETLVGLGVLGGPQPVPGTDVPAVAGSSEELVVPLLRHVGKRGNTTVYEWRTGLQPLRVERPEVEEVPEQPKEDTVRPGQRGPSCGAGESPPSWLCHVSVRVGLFAPRVSGGLLSFSPQIDWGDFTLEPTRVDDGAVADGGAQGEGIDWGITLEPSPQVCKPWLCGPGVWPRSRAGLGTWGCPGYPHLTGWPFFCSRMMALTGEMVKARRCRSRCWRPALRVSTAAKGQRGSQRVAGSTHPACTPPSLPAATLGILALPESLLGTPLNGALG